MCLQNNPISYAGGVLDLLHQHIGVINIFFVFCVLPPYTCLHPSLLQLLGVVLLAFVWSVLPASYVCAVEPESIRFETVTAVRRRVIRMARATNLVGAIKRVQGSEDSPVGVRGCPHVAEKNR